MKLIEVAEAKRAALRAKDRFDRTLAAAQHRLSPGNLAEEAWDGVKDKGADMAEGALQAVKSRPKAVSLALGAFFAGMILSESELSQRAAQETLPLRDAFAVLFFASVGPTPISPGRR